VKKPWSRPQSVLVPTPSHRSVGRDNLKRILRDLFFVSEVKRVGIIRLGSSAGGHGAQKVRCAIGVTETSHMILVSGPLIAWLRLHTRKGAHEAIRAGRFGPVIEHKQRSRKRGTLYVDLAAVDQDSRRAFSPEQIVDATEGRPDRIITVTNFEEEDTNAGSGSDNTIQLLPYVTEANTKLERLLT
jgi:hypothetical protein